MTIFFLILVNATLLAGIAAVLAKLGIVSRGAVPVTFFAGIAATALVLAFNAGAHRNDREVEG